MILAVQLGIMGFLLLVSLLVFLLVRQMGALSLRVLEPVTAGKVALEVGSVCPATVFRRVGRPGEIRIPMDDEEHSFLLFISFSCPICQIVLEEFRSVTPEVASRFILLFLDGNPAADYGPEVESLNLLGFPVAEGNELSTAFKVQEAPYLYVVGKDRIIEESQGLRTFDDWLSVARRYMTVDLRKRGIENAASK